MMMLPVLIKSGQLLLKSDTGPLIARTLTNANVVMKLSDGRRRAPRI